MWPMPAIASPMRMKGGALSHHITAQQNGLLDEAAIPTPFGPSVFKDSNKLQES